jgi:hypothetical protein
VQSLEYPEQFGDHRGFGHILHPAIFMLGRLLRHPLAGQCQASIQTHAA